MTNVDVVVVGLGPGGEYAANKLASAGLSVVGVDKHLVGGECPFYGCIPSKLLIAEAHRSAPSFEHAVQRIRESNHDWHDDGHVQQLEQAGVRIVRGHGRLAGAGRVEVDGQVFEAGRTVLLNPGTRPSVPPIEGLEGTPYWTNREVFAIRDLPESLVVLGAGPVGAELAQAFSRLGTRVTLLEVGPRILAPEEPEVSELVAGLLRSEGMDVRAGEPVERVEYADGFRVVVGGDLVRADHLLVATGRTSNLDDIGLETVGLDPEHLEADERMRVGERLHVIGDVMGDGAFTHVSIDQGRVVVDDVLGTQDPALFTAERAVSRVTFTDPEVGSVGLTEQQAREAGIKVRTAVSNLEKSSRGWIQEAQGLIKLVADADRGVLVGATVAGPAGGELLGMLTLAVHARVPVRTFNRMPFAYPTLHRAAQVALGDLLEGSRLG